MLKPALVRAGTVDFGHSGQLLTSKRPYKLC